ncbi:MAG: hypothetical protein GXY15_01845 [Candidatus Hydrogenedentes bacterium]|nr:hypothetical protein [Candidatus Hydrogenedentota bacterium]
MGMWGWKRKAHDGAKLVLVPVAVPKYAEHEVRALRDLGDDNPYWRAIVLVAAKLQGTIVKEAMQASGKRRCELLDKAHGTALLLAALEEKRTERDEPQKGQKA